MRRRHGERCEQDSWRQKQRRSSIWILRVRIEVMVIMNNPTPPPRTIKSELNGRRQGPVGQRWPASGADDTLETAAAPRHNRHGSLLSFGRTRLADDGRSQNDNAQIPSDIRSGRCPRRGAGAGAGLSRASGHHHGAVCRRRRLRPAGAAGVAAAGAEARQAVHHREPARRRHHASPPWRRCAPRRTATR